MTALSQKSIHNINRIDKKVMFLEMKIWKFEVRLYHIIRERSFSDLGYPNMDIEMIENLTR